MTWVRIHDGAMTHPKVLSAGPEAVCLWLAGLCYANGHHTDGAIPKHALPALYPSDKWTRAHRERAAARLVSIGLWHDEGPSWRIHGYAEYQEEALRENVEERREYEKLRKRAQREAKKRGLSPPLSRRDSPGHDTGTGGGRVPDVSQALVPAPGPAVPVVSQPPDPARPVPSEERGRSLPRADLISLLVSGFAQAYRENNLAPPKQTRALTWPGWHHLAVFAEDQAAVIASEPETVAQELSGRFFRSKKAKAAGYPLTFLAENPLEYWEAAS